ncbi:hypothetical protein L873DRAFT_1820413 [Choiromyces venosus 120613-1]|uniref:Uncharacterized protein n=1 Tax=Choiromyces venosus 120613-1 TaxID=1336337 RepID=A0A3N4IYE6_9PEZI|nr:hypothetical protein L873DRAFT_1820413 [Choiromyces venosus 120613-1]
MTLDLCRLPHFFWAILAQALGASEGRFVIAGHRIRLSMVSGTMVIHLEANTGVD